MCKKKRKKENQNKNKNKNKHLKKGHYISKSMEPTSNSMMRDEVVGLKKLQTMESSFELDIIDNINEEETK